jgi:adenosylhomocysteine nucleosidase
MNIEERGAAGNMNILGILAAVHDEIAQLLADMEPGAVTHRIGMRDYHCGRIGGRDCVLVVARIGKVAAAVTTATLIRQFGASTVLCTGLAGGIGPGVRVGDVVVADSLLQHDMDARPLFPRYEVPLLGQSAFETDPGVTGILVCETRHYLDHGVRADIAAPTLTRFGIDRPTVHRGLIASGDLFVSSTAEAACLREALPDALCVEMEGAAVAQVCFEHGVPFAVVRTISDRADDHATMDFTAFLGSIASVYSNGIVRRMLAAVAEPAPQP